MSNSDWINLEKIATFLQPFKDLTVKMSASSYSTVFMIIPLFNIIIDHVEDTEEAATLRLREAATAAKTKLLLYYSKTNTTTMLCTALDPRRKFNYFVKKEFSPDDIEKTKSL